MGTVLDMVKRLQKKSFRSAAQEVDLLDKAAPSSPISLRQILIQFANIAKPEIPSHVSGFVTEIVPLGEGYFVGCKVSWSDPGAKTFRFAAQFHLRLLGKFNEKDGPPTTLYWDAWKTTSPQTLPMSIDPSSDYLLKVRAWNPWGFSGDWGEATFQSDDPPSKSPRGPGASPLPHSEPSTPSQILFYNCDYTPTSETEMHQPVTFYLQDVTAGTPPQAFGPIIAGYYDNSSMGCGHLISKPTIIPLQDGHAYNLFVVKLGDLDQDCNEYSDVFKGCIEWQGTVQGGTQQPMPLQWPPV